MSNVMRLEDDDDEGSGIAVAAYFKSMDVVRVDFFPEDAQEGRAFMVVRGIGEPDENPNYRYIMEATNAKSVNLWYTLVEEGLKIIQDVEMVKDLEQALEYWEQDRRAEMH
jgi:hypothetical protein